MGRLVRVKLCNRCQQSAPVLYRVEYDDSSEGIFVCDRCWSSITQNNSFYQNIVEAESYRTLVRWMKAIERIYLFGTMVVVEEGRSYVGSELRVVVTSALQTSAGRMIFARPQASFVA